MTDTTQHKANLRDYFDGVGFERWSAIYGSGEGLSRVRRTIRAGHEQMLGYARAWVQEAGLSHGASALDAGCGTGLWSLELAQRGISVTAVDIAPQMAQSTTDRAVAAGLGALVTSRCGDLDSVEGSYDLVSCFDVLIHYPAASAGTMIAHLAQRARSRLLITYAPRRPLLVALHWLGGRFPQGNRRTEIQMLPDALVEQQIAAAGMRLIRRANVSSGFYHVTLLEAERIVPLNDR